MPPCRSATVFRCNIEDRVHTSDKSRPIMRKPQFVLVKQNRAERQSLRFCRRLKALGGRKHLNFVLANKSFAQQFLGPNRRKSDRQKLYKFSFRISLHSRIRYENRIHRATSWQRVAFLLCCKLPIILHDRPMQIMPRR